MSPAIVAAVCGVALLVVGLFLAAALIWSPLAGVAVVCLAAGGALTWVGLTYDMEE